MHSDPARLQEWQILYDRGAFVTVWRLTEEFGPPETWVDPAARIFAGRLLRFLGAAARGDRLILRTWRRFPDLSESRRHVAWIIAAKRGPWAAWQRVQRWLTDVTDDEPNRVEWVCLQAELLSRLRDFSRAEERLIEARRLDPSEPWVQVCWAYHYERSDRRAEAFAAVEQALVLNPNYPHALLGAAHLHQMLGRDDAAIAVLERAVRETENSAAALQLAVLYDELRRPDDLDRLLDVHVRLAPLADPSLQEYRARLRAQAAYHRGDFPAAATWARQAGTLSFFQAMADRLGNPAPEWRRVELPVGFVAQHHLTCVPATLTALAHFWQRPADHLEVSEAICYDGTSSHSERRWAKEHGWVAREFRVNLPIARALLDRAVPFAFTTVYPGGAHEQAVVGYDDFRATLLIRDPSNRNRTELIVDPGLEAQAASGPRGLALVPTDLADRLAGLELPDAELYDEHHELLLALDRHDRAVAAQALGRLESRASEHRLTWQARRALAKYDGNSAGQAAALEALLKQFPNDPNFQLSRLSLLRELAPTAERIARLRTACEAKDSDPLLWYELAWELGQDAREHGNALRWLQRAARFRPLDGVGFFIRAQIAWEGGDYEAALETYRFAACLDDKREDAAQAYFRAARWRGRAREALAWLTTRFEQDGTRSSLPGRTLAWAYNELNQTTAAFAALERAVERRPTDTTLRLHAVEEYARWGELRRAQVHLEAAQGPASPADWARAAAGLAARQVDTAEQIKQWRAVLTQEPTALDAHRHLAELLAETEGRPAALAHLESATQSFPYHLPLRQLAIGWLRDEGNEVWEQAVRAFLEVAPQHAWALRELAAALVVQKKFAAARASLEVAALLEPNSAALFNVRGDLYVAEGDTGAARREFEQALVGSVDNTWAMRRLLQSAVSGEARRAAIEFIQRELIRQTTVGDGLLEFAELARAYLTPEELERLLHEAHECRPDLWQTWSTLARQYSALGKHRDALLLIEAANERFPLWPRLWVDRARIHRARLEHAEELRALEKVRELSPTWGWAMRELAQAYYNAGRPEDARTVLEEAVRRRPLDGVSHAALGEARRKLGDLEGAIASLRTAVLIEPTYEWAWRELHDLGVVSGRPDLALELAEELVRRRPGEPRSWWLLARLLTGPEVRSRRLELLDRALALEPRLIAAHSLRAQTLAEAGQWEAAWAACRPAAVGEPRPAELVVAEADLRAERGNVETAVALIRAALALDPGFETGWRRLAHWLYLREDFDAAIQATEQLARLVPLDAVPLGYLGDLKLRRGDRPGAIEAFRRAFELDAQYTFGGGKLFELQLEDSDFTGAAETARRLQPHLTEPEYLDLQAALALAQHQSSDFADALRRFCQCPKEHPGATSRLAGRIQSANWNVQAEAVVRPLLSEAATNPETGPLWVELARFRSLRQRLPVLESLGFERELAIRAWERWLDEVGDELGAAVSRHDSFRWFQDRGFRRVLRRHRAALQQPTRLWGKVGYVLIRNQQWRLLVHWLSDWRSRTDALPWMLNNLALGLAHTRQEKDFRDLVGRMVAFGHRDEFSVRFELWHALFALADDVEAPAAALADELHPERLGSYDRSLYEALRVWRRFPAGTETEPFTGADRASLREFARRHAREPVLRSLFYRLMRRTAARTSWRWTRLWVAVGPGTALRQVGYGVLILLSLVVIAASRGALFLPTVFLVWWLRRKRAT